MRTDLSGLTFIIVAGEELASGDLADSLIRRGARAVIAQDCAGAFEAIEHGKPDFAILDWAMDDCDAVAAELNALDVPHLYIGSPQKREREPVRSHVSSAFADAMLTILNDDEAAIVPTEPSHNSFLR